MNKPDSEVHFIFLPGVPGRKKDFGFMTDLRSVGLPVIEFRHSGLYEQGGKFSIKNTTDDMISLFESFEKSKTSYVIIAYSLSSLIVQGIALEKFKYLKGVVMFSPVFGLGHDWINEDFNETIDRLIATKDCRPAKALATEITNLKNNVYGFDTLQKLIKNQVPLGLVYSRNDNSLNVNGLAESVKQFRNLYGHGKIFIIGEPKGDHRIDTYYGESTRNLLLAFVAREQVHNLLGDTCFTYVWGSSQNTNFFKDRYSDIDLYVLSDNYLKYFAELSELQLSFKSRFGVKLDLSINKVNDLLNERISRFNRGPLLTHALNHLYFSLERKKIEIDVDFEDVMHDCYKATLSIYRECEKQISRINGSDEQIRWFAKLYTVAVFYLLHTRGYSNVDMNNLEQFLDTKSDKELLKFLRVSSQILKGESKNLKKEEWIGILKAIHLMSIEEEKTLHIEYRTYDLKSKNFPKTVDTPGKSRVLIFNQTKKVFKTYFQDTNKKIRDVARITTHYEQMKFLEEHSVNVPSGLKLIENGSAIIMDYVDGSLLEDMIKRKDAELQSVLAKLSNSLPTIHKTLNLLKNKEKNIIKDDELNYHCARNFQIMSLPNLLSLGETESEKVLKSLAQMATEVIAKTPELLGEEDVIYGDFKPENIIWSHKEKDFYLLDPMIARGRVSCDMGKMISRIILSNSGVYSNELINFIKSIRSGYGADIANESIIMSAFDMMNFVSRIIKSEKHKTRLEKSNVYASQLDNIVPNLLRGKIC